MKPLRITIIHLVFWLIMWSTNLAFLLFRGNAVVWEQYASVGIKSLLEFGVFYLFYAWIVPRFFHKGNYFRFGVVALIFCCLLIIVYALGMTSSMIELKLAASWKIFGFEVIMATYYVILYAFLGGFLFLAIQGISDREQKMKLEQQHTKTELALLRSQVNPHFLFNTLNTIHSYVTENHPDRAKSIILLSDIMRYMLYEASGDKILLSKEIGYIESFIKLHELRFERNCMVTFHVDGEAANIRIPPMILIPFVENAFKHGTFRKPEHPLKIQLSIGNNIIVFMVENHVDPVKAVTPEASGAPGMGLDNVKRRLDLLYPANYSLVIDQTDKFYRIKLKIPQT